jgi:hypothetical protein
MSVGRASSAFFLSLDEDLSSEMPDTSRVRMSLCQGQTEAPEDESGEGGDGVLTQSFLAACASPHPLSLSSETSLSSLLSHHSLRRDPKKAI